MFSGIFEAVLRNLVRSSFLVTLYTVYCKRATPAKSGLLGISRRATFQNTPCTCYISRQNAEVSVTLPKSDSTTDAFLTILKIFGTNKVNICGGVSFRYSYS